MKNTLKKAMCLAVALLLLVGCMSGCAATAPASSPVASAAAPSASAVSPSAESSASPSASTQNAEGNALPLVASPTTLDVLTVRWNGHGDTFKGNPFLVNLEKATNVKINWIVKFQADWETTQRSLMLASNELPSVAIGDLTFRDTDVQSNLDKFVPLDDLVQKDMPNYRAILEQNPYMKKYVTYPDGKMYSMCGKLPCRGNVGAQPIINKAWLDRLGLKAPETIDELYTVLKAFKDKDANGNGDPNDEIPFTGVAINTMFDNQIMVLFDICDLNGKWMMLKDEAPAFIPATENFKQCVIMLRKWYSEGIMDKEYFTQSNDMATAKYHSVPSRVGFCYSWTPDSNFSETQKEYEVLPPLTGFYGNKSAVGDPHDTMAYRRMALEITSSCKDPDLAAKWADQFYTNEASIQNFWGGIGVVIQKNSDGTYQLMDPPGGTNADQWYWNSCLRDFGPKFTTPEFDQKILLNKSGGDGYKNEISKLVPKDSLLEPYPSILMTQEENDQLAAIETTIRQYAQTTAAKWITEGGIETEWDGYIAQLKKMQLDTLVKLYTDVYNRYLGK